MTRPSNFVEAKPKDGIQGRMLGKFKIGRKLSASQIEELKVWGKNNRKMRRAIAKAEGKP